jgi:hypothetical protein
MALIKNDEVIINFDADEDKIDAPMDYLGDIRNRGFLDPASISIKQNLATGEISLNAHTNQSADLTL